MTQLRSRRACPPACLLLLLGSACGSRTGIDLLTEEGAAPGGGGALLDASLLSDATLARDASLVPPDGGVAGDDNGLLPGEAGVDADAGSTQPSCGACGGCCGTDGTCQGGTDPGACGFGGVACVACPTGETCNGWTCGPVVTTLVLFGGLNGDLVQGMGSSLDDTWIWNDVSWQKAHVPGAHPSARSGHAMAAFRGKVVLFGGSTALGRGDLGDTWEWDGVSWTQVATSGPSPREGARMSELDGKLVLFGGWTATSPMTADTWEWDGTLWTQRATTEAPPPRAWHCMATMGRNVVLTEGVADQPPRMNDTWLWNGDDWTQVFPPHAAPSYESACAMAPLGGTLFFTGQNPGVARSAVDYKKGESAPTFVWDEEGWNQALLFGPQDRDFVAMAALPSHAVLFGGEVDLVGGNVDPKSRDGLGVWGGLLAGDTWMFDGHVWTEAWVPGPPARTRSALAGFAGDAGGAYEDAGSAGVDGGAEAAAPDSGALEVDASVSVSSDGGVPDTLLPAVAFDFGVQPCGANAPVPFFEYSSFGNTGTAPLAYAIRLVSPQFETWNVSSVVSPGDSRIAGILAQAVPSGAIAGEPIVATMEVATDAPPPNDHAAYPVTVVALGANVQILPATTPSASWSHAAVGVAAPPVSLLLQNTGNAPATVTIAAPDDPAFTLAQGSSPITAPIVIPAASGGVPGSVTLEATFTPTAAGAVSAMAPLAVARPVCNGGTPSATAITFRGSAP